MHHQINRKCVAVHTSFNFTILHFFYTAGRKDCYAMLFTPCNNVSWFFFLLFHCFDDGCLREMKMSFDIRCVGGNGMLKWESIIIYSSFLLTIVLVMLMTVSAVVFGDWLCSFDGVSQVHYSWALAGGYLPLSIQTIIETNPNWITVKIVNCK